MPIEVKTDPLILVNINGEGIVAPASVAARMQQRARTNQQMESTVLLAEGLVAGASFLVARALGVSTSSQEAAIRIGANLGTFGIVWGARSLPIALRGAQATPPFQAKKSEFSEKPYTMSEQRALAKHEIFKAELGRWMDKPIAHEPALAKCVDELFRDNASVRNGSTASALRYERQSGETVGDKFHDDKANNKLSFLNRWIEANPLANNDRMVAEILRRDLRDALSTPTFPGYFVNVRAHRARKTKGSANE